VKALADTIHERNCRLTSFPAVRVIPEKIDCPLPDYKSAIVSSDAENPVLKIQFPSSWS
jgi:hypothetical protein